MMYIMMQPPLQCSPLPLLPPQWHATLTDYSLAGYGNMSPSSTAGQIFCVFFALFGIPLNMVVLNRVGKYILVIERNVSDFLEGKTGRRVRTFWIISSNIWVYGGTERQVMFIVVILISATRGGAATPGRIDQGNNHSCFLFSLYSTHIHTFRRTRSNTQLSILTFRSFLWQKTPLYQI